MLHPLEFAAVLTAARQHSNSAHALVALLGMLGLRMSEACQAQVADRQYTGGHQVLHVLGKGRKPADITLPIPVLRAVEAAVAGRQEGAILQTGNGLAMKRGAAARLLNKIVRLAGVGLRPRGARPLAVPGAFVWTAALWSSAASTTAPAPRPSSRRSW